MNTLKMTGFSLDLAKREIIMAGQNGRGSERGGTEIREKAVREWSQAENADLIDVRSTTRERDGKSN